MDDRNHSVIVTNVDQNEGKPAYVHDGKDVDLLRGKKTLSDYCWPAGSKIRVRTPWGIVTSVQLQLPDGSKIELPPKSTALFGENGDVWRPIFTDEQLLPDGSAPVAP